MSNTFTFILLVCLWYSKLVKKKINGDYNKSSLPLAFYSWRLHINWTLHRIRANAKVPYRRRCDTIAPLHALRPWMPIINVNITAVHRKSNFYVSSTCCLTDKQNNTWIFCSLSESPYFFFLRFLFRKE